MTALPDEQRSRLREAKVGALARARIHHGEWATVPFPSGAAASRPGPGGAALVLIENADERALGLALLWAARHAAGPLHVGVEATAEIAALGARRAEPFRDVAVWHGPAPSMSAAAPAAMPNAVAAPDSHDGPAAKLVAAGLEVVVEDGMTKGEWNGLEIVRVVGPDAQVEVGIGRFDREIAAMMRAGAEPDASIDRALQLVRRHRVAGAPPHPLRDLVPERWVRRSVVEHPDLVGAAWLQPVPTTIAPRNLRDRQPAAALGERADGRPILAVCISGADPDVVPTALDTQRWLAPDAEVVIASVEVAARELFVRVAEQSSVPVSWATVPAPWAPR